LSQASSASAFAFIGCTSLNLIGSRSYDSYYRHSGLGDYYRNLTMTVADTWSSKSRPSNLRYSLSEAQSSIQIYRGFYSWSAFAQTVWTCTSSGGRFTSRKIYYNRNSMDAFTDKQDQFVIAHEFGHAQGLAHNTKACATSVMHSDAWYANTGCTTVTPPWSDDVAGLDALY
jgi:hypothetical protein